MNMKCLKEAIQILWHREECSDLLGIVNSVSLDANTVSLEFNSLESWVCMHLFHVT